MRGARLGILSVGKLTSAGSIAGWGFFVPKACAAVLSPEDYRRRAQISSELARRTRGHEASLWAQLAHHWPELLRTAKRLRRKRKSRILDYERGGRAFAEAFRAGALYIRATFIFERPQQEAHCQGPCARAFEAGGFDGRPWPHPPTLRRPVRSRSLRPSGCFISADLIQLASFVIVNERAQ